MTTSLPSHSLAETPIADASSAPLRDVDRAAMALRRGDIALMTADDENTMVMAVEGATSEGLARLARLGGGDCILVISAPRAAALKLLPATGPVMVAPLDKAIEAAALRALADPTAPLDDALYAALKRIEQGAPRACDQAAVALSKRARLLPAAITAAIGAAASRKLIEAGDIDVVAADAVIDYERRAAANLRPVSETTASLHDAGDVRIISFRPGDGGAEHLAVIIGDPGGPGNDAPLTRLHSECFTGDLLGSLRCDCGDQLRAAISAMAAEGGGLLIYLAQEGRGIGLVNKLRAYNLQDAGFDTLDANHQLGFDADERLYLPAAEILRQLGYRKVRLMTNNPDKVAGLSRNGIEVADRVPLVMPASGLNDAYLATKAKRFGHIL